MFNNESPLCEVLDCVIVNASLHIEFKEETHRDYSILPINERLEYWNTFEGKPSLPVCL